jgi:hypothetical protein
LFNNILLKLAFACICCASVAVIFLSTATHKLLESNQLATKAFCCIKSNILKLLAGTLAVCISAIAQLIGHLLQSIHISLGHCVGLVKSILLGIKFLSYNILFHNASLVAFCIIKLAYLLCALCLSSNKSTILFQYGFHS